MTNFLIGDPGRLQQILGNLFNNGLKFTKHGGISLVVTILEQTPQELTLRFTVRDSGIGINSKQQQAIFAAFTQADGSLNREYGGIGLGLTIANQLIKRLHGQPLQLTSEPGHGSSFFFSLTFPIGQPLNQDSCQPQLDACQSANILLVEDNKLNRTLASKIITGLGHQVKIAENGAIAVSLVKSESFDLIFMDIQMPIMDGYAATRAIRAAEHAASRSAVPIVAMTANVRQVDKERCFAAGMTDFLAKPITRTAVAGIIAKIL